jgi:hypothetical protein
MVGLSFVYPFSYGLPSFAPAGAASSVDFTTRRGRRVSRSSSTCGLLVPDLRTIWHVSSDQCGWLHDDPKRTNQIFIEPVASYFRNVASRVFRKFQVPRERLGRPPALRRSMVSV